MGAWTEPFLLLATVVAGLGALTPDWAVEPHPGRHADEASAAQASAPGIHTGADGRFRVATEIRGKPLVFLLDTGASTTILSGRDARLLGLRESGRAVTVRGVGGQTAAWQITIEGMTIGNRRIDRVEALVVDDLEASLLGMNVVTLLGPLTLVPRPAI